MSEVSSFSQNYYELFALPVNFDIDQADLDGHFRGLQQAVHPDRFASASAQEKRLSLQKATLINEAHRVLSDPLLRARYLLELRGESPIDEQETISDVAFLMEQMELREELDAVKSSADPLSLIGDILDELIDKIEQREQEIRQLFVDNQLQPIRDTIRKFQFLYKLRSEAESLEADLEQQL
ncbi:Chaperone protein HscB [hydrothermal vent metagenome]|uniref:Chaperone protein HscB n=1 Tax=hydrothermal vent metagenome TaxID=652676 RepID=A0A3B0YNJ2_9ZZZZ